MIPQNIRSATIYRTRNPWQGRRMLEHCRTYDNIKTLENIELNWTYTEWCIHTYGEVVYNVAIFYF